MLANIAVGLLESSGIAKGFDASDAMCKMASVQIARAGRQLLGKDTLPGPGANPVNTSEVSDTPYLNSEMRTTAVC